MSEFLLLFRGEGKAHAYGQRSPEEGQKLMMKWTKWVESLAKEGKFVSGEPLSRDGAVVRGTKKLVTDGPFTEGKEVIGGFILVNANNIKEAVELSRGCPILEFEGNVEVREVHKMQM